MSEQAPQNQNQNLLNEQEMRDRDDAIFNTVADFRNELDNPNSAEQAPAQTPDEFDSRMDALEAKMKAAEAKTQAARQELDLDAGNGRHRKAYNAEAEDTAAKAGMQYRAKRVAQQMANGVSENGLQGLPIHRGSEDFAAVAMAKEHKNGEPIEELPEELKEGEGGIINSDALAAAEAAARDKPQRNQVAGPLGSRGELAPEAESEPDTPDTNATPVAPASMQPVRGRHRRVRGSRPDAHDPVNVAQQAYAPAQSAARPPQIDMNSLSDGGTPGVLRPENQPERGDDGHAISDDGHLLGTNGSLGGKKAPRAIPDGEVGVGHTQTNLVVGGENNSIASADTPEGEPVTVTPEASLRNRVVGKLATATATTGRALRGAKDVASSFVNYGLDLAYRTPADQLDDKELRARPKVRALGVVAGGLVVATAVLGANKLAADHGVEHIPGIGEAAATASQTPGQSQFGPKAPKTSETPTPSASASASEIPTFGPSPSASSQEATPTKTPSASATSEKFVVGPTESPSTTPDVSSKPHAPESEPVSATPTERIVQAGDEQLKFSADGKEVTVTLNRGGTVWDGVSQAERQLGINSDDTATANAIQSVGFKSGEASQLPVGAHVTFKLQDGKLVAQ